MVKKLTLSFVAVALLSGSLFAKADMELVNRYMQVSGATQTLEGLTTQITDSMQQTSLMYGKEVDPAQMAFFEKVFSPDENIKIIKAYLQEHFNNSELKRIIAFDESEIGSDFIEAGIEAMENSMQPQMFRFMADLQENPPSRKRVETIRQLNTSLEVSETMITVYNELMHFFIQSAGIKDKNLQNQLAQMETLFQQAIEQQLFLSSLFVYRDLSNEQLKKVIAFYQTDAGKREIEVLREAIVKMVKDGFSRALSR